MAETPVRELPPFPSHATTTGFLTDSEIDRLIAEHEPLLTEGQLGAGGTNPQIRRYERVWAAARECKRQFFAVDIATGEGIFRASCCIASRP